MEPTDRPPDELRAKLESLEREVSDLKQAIDQINQKLAGPPTQPSPSHPSTPPPVTRSIRPSRPAKRPRSTSIAIPERMKRFDYWLNRIGIGLLLFGVAFLFKYSIDRGWITPWLRIAFSFLLGGGLAATGLWLHSKRRNFATILIGGAIGTWYITGFSAFQLLELVSHPQAMIFMGAVTLFSFVISLRQDEPILSLIGALGGFGTPFLLYTGQGNLPGLMAHSSLLVLLTGGLFFFKGWKSLLWLTVVCGWGVIITGIASRTWLKSEIGTIDQWAVEGAILLCWLIFAGVPIMREWTWLKNPERWARSTLGFADKTISARAQELLDRHLHVLAVSAPIVAYTLSIIIWPHLNEDERGWIAIVVATVYIPLTLIISRLKTMKAVGHTHGLAVAFFLTIGLAQLYDGETLLISLAAEGLILHIIAGLIRSFLSRFTAHWVTFIPAIWLWTRLGDNLANPFGFLSAFNLADLVAIVSFALSAMTMKRGAMRQVYAIGSALFLTMMFIRETSGPLEFALIGLVATIAYIISRVIYRKPLYLCSHLIFVGSAAFFAARLVTPETGLTPLVNLTSLAALFLLALYLLPALSDERRVVRWIYALAAHIGVLGLLASELARLDNGAGWVSFSWGAYGALMLVLGLRKNWFQIRLVAMGTLMLLVLKLFLIDLARLETIWRVLLFIGVGAAFLALGYLFPSLWKDQPEQD